MSDKTSIRQGALGSRSALGPEARERASAQAIAQVQGLELWARSRTVMLYAAFREELDLRALGELALGQGKVLCLPQADPAVRALTVRKVASYGQLEPGYAGIPEPDPASCPAIEPAELDLVIVPGASFDLQGGRLGYGAGYYDRFLRACPRAFRLGVCFEVQVSPQPLPQAPHDARMQGLVTEGRCLLF